MRRLSLLLAFGVGFLSLSQEILWIRLLSFGQQGRPHAFSMVLTVFLLAIAAGSFVGRRICTRASDPLRAGGWVLVAAAVMDLTALYAASTSLGQTIGSPRALAVMLSLVAMTAGLKGILFPIVHHLGSESSGARVGRSVSRVYLSNVFGSTLGPFVTGFILLDKFSLEIVFALIATLTAVLAILALKASPGKSRIPTLVSAVSAGVCGFVVSHPPTVMSQLALVGPGQRIVHLTENRQGVIHIQSEDQPGRGDITFGGNAYDGYINVNIKKNSNLLDRAYLMAVLHPGPKKVLIVGLSTGAWASLIAGIPGIEQIDIVEINPGYADVIRMYPQVAPLLDDKRIQIHIDDGRRWLRHHPDRQYDLIFQNTTWHWRAYSSQLLSSEYFHELASHLAARGVAAVNTTSSYDVHFTAMSVFAHTIRYNSFVYMSQDPLQKRADAEAVLRSCTVWGVPAFDDSLFENGQIGASLVHDELESSQHYIDNREIRDAPRIVSDLNLVTEYRHGNKPPFPWLEALLPKGSAENWRRY